MSNFTLQDIVTAYTSNTPNPEDATKLVSFGTSGHRGKAFASTFTQSHVLAISQAVCDYRHKNDINGPVFLGQDTHAVSAPAHRNVLEVLAANGVHVLVHQNNLPTPTPVISHAILSYNKNRTKNVADGIIVTPSHNPPEDGGIKYNEYHGGPAGEEVTKAIQERANFYLQHPDKINRITFEKALQSGFVHQKDFITPYVDDLQKVLHMQAIAQSGLRIGVDPLGGSSVPFFEPIADTYGISLVVARTTIDPLFSFMPQDHDGVIRMDCSSPYAMKELIGLATEYDISFGNDPDADRHGIVTPQGLMPSNQYLAVAIYYLLQNRPLWSKKAIGKTCVTTGIIDKICRKKQYNIHETPVGFKWFVDGLYDGSCLLGGEESAGASFVRLDGSVWSTDKDGMLLGLLAAEITAVTGKNPAELYEEVTEKYGNPLFCRIDSPATPQVIQGLKNLDITTFSFDSLAGETVQNISTTAQGNNQAIGGLKVMTQNGWFAARPSGTEPLYKIYAESFIDDEHLQNILSDAKEFINTL